VSAESEMGPRTLSIWTRQAVRLLFTPLMTIVIVVRMMVAMLDPERPWSKM
jgi:phage terminase large subunit-like protein